MMINWGFSTVKTWASLSKSYELILWKFEVYFWKSVNFEFLKLDCEHVPSSLFLFFFRGITTLISINRKSTLKSNQRP